MQVNEIRQVLIELACNWAWAKSLEKHPDDCNVQAHWGPWPAHSLLQMGFKLMPLRVIKVKMLGISLDTCGERWKGGGGPLPASPLPWASLSLLSRLVSLVGVSMHPAVTLIPDDNNWSCFSKARLGDYLFSVVGKWLTVNMWDK